MYRRGFIGGLVAGAVGWFGVKQAKAETLPNVTDSKDVRYSFKVANTSEGSKQASRLLHKPNGDDTFDSLMRKVVEQLYLTGTGLLWAVHNKLSHPFLLYSVTTATAFPHSASEEYPHGYYCIAPMYPEGEIPGDWMSRQAAVPAEHVVKVVCPHPLLEYRGFAVPYWPFVIDRQFAQAVANKIADKLTKHLRPHFGDGLSITITAH